MEHNPDRICVWPGYFDAKTSRRGGRRVPRDSSVLKPDLEGLYLAARKVGLKKIKREEGTSHPQRPYACLLYTSPSPRDAHESRMPSSA